MFSNKYQGKKGFWSQVYFGLQTKKKQEQQTKKKKNQEQCMCNQPAMYITKS